ncbi:cytochrome b [Vibrio kanaloae]|uniref:Cytochrome b n=1 Tax=Vibrio kanaloae TaxID=170673 RepID=A0A4U1YUG8_9VIBR|nr:cytochrome b/b6 domain-containing protein [Vibrio kanaloae]TKF24399.1 cytochrome b [Vibrio kanaloae]
MKSNFDYFTRLLHWSLAIIILYTLIGGYVMHLVIDSSPEIFNILSVLNMSVATIGVPIFLVRYLWKYFRPSVVKEPSEMKNQPAVKLAHSIIYLLMFLVFLTGFLMIKDSYFLFWLIEIPNPIDNKTLNDFFFLAHRYLCIALLVMVLLHVIAAFYHHLICKDKTLLRMIGKA